MKYTIIALSVLFGALIGTGAQALKPANISADQSEVIQNTVLQTSNENFVNTDSQQTISNAGSCGN